MATVGSTGTTRSTGVVATGPDLLDDGGATLGRLAATLVDPEEDTLTRGRTREATGSTLEATDEVTRVATVAADVELVGVPAAPGALLEVKVEAAGLDVGEGGGTLNLALGAGEDVVLS